MKLKTNTNFVKHIKLRNHLINRIKCSLTDYLKHYPIEVINSIKDEEFINTNPSYYLYYPYLFNDFFDFHDKKTLDLISIAAFLYYKSVILIDDIFDNDKKTNNFQNYFIANICQEETIKILSMFFDINTSFWKTWNVRKFEYVKAYQLDKTLQHIKTYKEFENLADYKSAVGKVAIDCLFYLSKKKNHKIYKLLLESHKFFYAGFQIMDDIVDYEEDFKNSQFNIAKHELIIKFDAKNEIISDYSLEEQKKMIYLTGVAEDLYIKSSSYLNKSIVPSNQDNLWVSEIKNLYNTSISHYLNISGFVKKYHTEQKRSENKSKQRTLDKVIKKAINYVTSRQLPEGCWNDFYNDAGVSDNWVTAYVLNALSNIKEIDDILMDKGKNYLIKNQYNHLWGYNKMWIADADSSSFALLSLKYNLPIIEKSLLKWIQFQNKDGGFTTYYDKEELLSSLNSPEIEDVSGWLQSHFCVSAVSYLVFIELEITNKEEFNHLRKYLFSQLKNSKNHLSYWWSSDIYSIYYILLGAIKFNDDEMIKVCEKYIKKFITQKKINIFYKALLLNILCLTDSLFNKYSIEITNLLNEILINQYLDGSWKENYSLQVPHPSKLNNEKTVWTKDTKGTNIIINDYNRIFTSVTCLTALTAYENRIR